MIDNEIQRRRTFEVIAKWIAQKTGVTIQFVPDATPSANLKAKRIVLPNNIKEENLDSVLALVLHEAGHINKTPVNLGDIATSQEEFSVLNSAEDIRIDTAMYSYLPAIKRFYDKLAEWENQHKPDNAPFEFEVLCNVIRRQTGYSQYNENEKAEEFVDKHNLMYLFSELIEYISKWNKSDTKDKMEEITNIIYGKKRTPKQGQGEGDPTGDPTQNPVGKPASNNKSNGGNGGKSGSGSLGCSRYKTLFETDPNAKIPLNDVSLEEQTKLAFNELLTVKSLRKIYDTKQLDTDNLTAFFTGDIEELFIDNKIVRYKKSKIMLLLDSSGSMQSISGLCDTKERRHIVANVTKRLQEMLDDVRETEGVNVDYNVRAYDDKYYVLNKENWYQEYCNLCGGATYLDMAFEKAQQEILNDPSIDGNKLIILITDGEVGRDQTDKIKELITKHNEDVRCLILGVGLDQEFEKEVGGRNIIAESLADGVILQAIEDLLG